MKINYASIFFLLGLIGQAVFALPVQSRINTLEFWEEGRFYRMTAQLNPVNSYSAPWNLKVTFPSNADRLWTENGYRHVFGAFELLSEDVQSGTVTFKPQRYVQDLVNGAPITFEAIVQNHGGASDSNVRNNVRFEIIPA
jgi:hypothetical protein